MVYQHRKAVPGSCNELCQQDVTGLKSRRVDPARLRAHQREPGSPVQQRTINPPWIRRVEMHDLVVQFTQCRLGHKLRQDKPVLHLCHSHDIRQRGVGNIVAASHRSASRPQNGFCDSVAFPVESCLAPSSRPCSRKLRVGLPRPVILEIEKVLHIPEHHGDLSSGTR